MGKNEDTSAARVTKKPAETANARTYSGRGIARISLVIAVMSLILVLFLLPRVLSSSSTDSLIINPTPTPTEPAECAPGLSAYDLWLAIGNEGTIEDFLNSIVGEKGADGYVGSDGFSGGNGASAYEMWLQAGNQGTPQIFLQSLVGASGASGVAGSPGSAGAPGSDGTDGAAGISAYQLWLEQGNTGTESEFLAFLLGEQGPAGADGAAGQSSYELWTQQAGNEDKTEAEFLDSLVGPEGPAGVCTIGDTGPAGPPGPAGGFGYSGAWYDISDQEFGSPEAKPMLFGVVDYEDGIKMVDKSRLTFETPGIYNIQFSAQLSYPTGGRDQLVNIWLAKNGNSIANTNSRVIVPGANDGYVVAAWNFFVKVDSGDYVELIWDASDRRVQIHHEPDPGGSGLYQPGIPSVILTVNQVSG